VIGQHEAPDLTIVSEDVEERGSLADRLLFWLLKHPYQRMSDLAFVFHVHASTICRHLLALTERHLVASVTSAIVAPSRPEALYYLATTGIERVADLIGGADPVALARMWQVGEADLLRLLPRLQSFIPLQEVVHGLIAGAPRQLSYPGGHPAAIRWHWQRDYTHTFGRGTKRITCRTDGAVVFRRRLFQQEDQNSSDESWHCFLLSLDPGWYGSEDLRLIRERLEHVLSWRESSERWSVYHAFPSLLVVASTAHQRDLWLHCAQEAAAHLRVTPLKGACAVLSEKYSPWQFSWHALDGSGTTALSLLAEPLVPQALPPGLLAPRHMASGMLTRAQKRRSLVSGDFEVRSKRLDPGATDLTTTENVALLSLRFSHRHIEILKQIYAVPLIATHELAALLRMEADTIRRYLYDLHHFRCLEPITTVRGKRIVLSETGLRLISLVLGVPLVHIAERNPSTNVWQLRGVKHALRTINHTAGIYTFLAQLQQQAWTCGQELLWWETTRSLRRYRFQGSWHNLMPDALFGYQAGETKVEAWLEWDTGSMHRQPLTSKFEAYAQYVRSRQYRQEHQVPPALLLVTPHVGREQYIRRVATSVLGTLPLAVWTTTAQFLQVEGPLAMIWKSVSKEQELEDEQRVGWIEQKERMSA